MSPSYGFPQKKRAFKIPRRKGDNGGFPLARACVPASYGDVAKDDCGVEDGGHAESVHSSRLK